MRWLALLFLVGGLLAACEGAGGTDGTAGPTDAEGGDGAAAPDAAGGDGAAAPDAGAADPDGAARGDAAPDAEMDAGVDAGVDAAPADPPRLADPCGTDLDAPNGHAPVAYPAPPDGGVFTRDPGEAGPFEVLLEEVAVPNPDPERETLAGTLFTPSVDGATPAQGPLPLVVVFPGFGIRHPQYAPLATHLASHGFVVVTATPSGWSFAAPQEHPKTAADLLAVLDWALADSPVAARLDPRRLALAGHSAGGKMAFFAAALDPRVGLVIGWDPQNGGGPPCAIAETMDMDCNRWPVAPNCEADDPGQLANLHAESLVFAARDTTFTPDAHLHAEHFYRGAPSPAHLLLFPAASHTDWIQASGAVTLLTKRVHTALLLTRFRGLQGLSAWLPGGAALAAETMVEVHTK